jgi:UDP-N-acetyl-2-amino-2-deoxyglucuronate dehydrogenase
MLNVALLGCGRIARRHSDLLGSGSVGGMRLCAACDLEPAKSALIADKYSVPAYSDMISMVTREKPDVVSVLTPSGLHAQHVIRLCPHVPNIIVEKPMALTLKDADAMIAACEKAGCRLFVVLQNRFNVPVVKLREALDEGRFGTLVLGTVRVRWCRPQQYYDQDSWRGTWALDGGVIANQACHHVDMLQWMMGSVETVFARSAARLVSIETEDTAVVSVKFMSGALGIIEATNGVRPKDLEGSISILGEKGSVEIGGFAVNAMKVWNFADPRPGDELVHSQYSVNPPNVYGFGHLAYYEHVVQAIKGERKDVIDGHEGRKSLVLVSAIYESIETGREVSMDRVTGHSRLGRI